MVDERGTGLAVAGDDVDHTGRDPRLECQLAQPQRAQRRLLGGLEHDGAAGGKRGRELPRGHQQREIPRDDLPADADRLLARVAEHSGLVDRQHVAGRALGPAREVAEMSGSGRDVDDLGELDGLAVVERLELGQLVGVLLDRLGQTGQHARAIGRRCLRPRAALERSTSGAHGAIDVLAPALGDLGDGLRGRWVERLERAAVGGRRALAVDQQRLLARDELACRLGELLGQRGHGVSTIFIASRRS